MKNIALAALALSALATPAFAGPYVESKHEFKGTDEDFSKQVHQGQSDTNGNWVKHLPMLRVVLVALSPMRVKAKPSMHSKLVAN